MMRVIQDPYFRKAVEFAELAEQAKDAQKRANYAVLADCYRRLSRRANANASAHANIAAKPESARADKKLKLPTACRKAVTHHDAF